MGITKSRYLEFFQENAARFRSEAPLIGDILLVEKITFPEKKVGSIILADARNGQINGLTSDMPTFYRVLLVGEGYYDDDTKEDMPLGTSQGDIILTGSVSVKTFSSFPLLEVADSHVLGVVRDADVQWKFKDEETFFRFLTDLNQAAKTQMDPGQK